MTEQPGLFDEQEAVGPINTAVLRALIEADYTNSPDPRTNLPFKSGVIDEFMDQVIYGGHRPGDEVEVKNLGKFVFLAQWGEENHGSKNGFVIKDLNTLNEYLFTYEYNSWDSDEFEVVLAESYTFSETRWRKKR